MTLVSVNYLKKNGSTCCDRIFRVIAIHETPQAKDMKPVEFTSSRAGKVFSETSYLRRYRVSPGKCVGKLCHTSTSYKFQSTSSDLVLNCRFDVKLPWYFQKLYSVQSHKVIFWSSPRGAAYSIFRLCEWSFSSSTRRTTQRSRCPPNFALTGYATRPREQVRDTLLISRCVFFFFF